MTRLQREKQKAEGWKQKAMNRGDLLRRERKERKRIKAQRDELKKELKSTRESLKEMASQLGKPAVLDKVALVSLGLQLFAVAHIGFRAVSRVLTVLAEALGIKKAPCPQTVINWVIRLSLVRIDSISQLNSTPEDCVTSPKAKGWIYMIDISIGLGIGKILAILGLRADHHGVESGSPSLSNVHCIAVAVSDSWTGEAIAVFLERVIAVTGPPLAYLKDAGTDLQKGVRLVGEKGYSSFCIDDISHFVANLLKWRYLEHPMFETFLSVCGRISGKLKQTILACLTPPKTQTKARFMNMHRLVRWAEQLLKLSPPRRASKGSVLSKLRECLDKLTECKGFIKAFLSDALPLLKCEKILKTRGLSKHTLAQCQALIQSISSHRVREYFRDYLDCHLEIAHKLGLEEIGMPLTSDPVECLFGLGKQLGTGETMDADRIALRLPAFCGLPTREEAELIVRNGVAEQRHPIANIPSLTKLRRRVLQHPEQLESLNENRVGARVELVPQSKNRSKNPEIEVIPISYENMLTPDTECRSGHG
jgi:hypothetical protein